MSEELQALQDVARKFAREEIIPVAAEHDRTGEVWNHNFILFEFEMHSIYYNWGSGGQWGHLSPQNLHNRGLAPTNSDNVPNHSATKQSLYYSHHKSCKAFQCDLSCFD